MKRTLALVMLFAAALSLQACGVSGSGGSSTDLSPDEQMAAAEMVMMEAGISTAVENALGGAAAMAVDTAKEMKADAVTVECGMGGTLTINGTAGTYTATFSNCASFMDMPGGGGPVSFSITGNIVIAGGNVTYNDLSVVWVCVFGGREFHTCHLSGSSTGSGDSVTYNLNGYCGATNFGHSGTVSGTMRDGHFIINGSATYTITGTSSGRIVRCTYSDFDVTAATCSEYATACGLSATYACASECPSS